MGFVSLHTHTEYSLLDGSGKIKEMVARAKELGMPALAITDHGVMYGVIDFYKAAKEAGIKPIIGCEVYVSPGSRFDRERVHGEDRYYHLVLLAKNNTGYSNLMKLVSKGFTEGFYYKPRVDLEVLEKYHEGIIALSACLAGEVSRYLSRDMYAEAKAAALRYRDIFGEGNFYLELQDHGDLLQKKVNQSMLELSKDTGIKLVVTNDVHYTYEEDAQAHDILLCIQTAKKVHDTDRMKYEGGQFFLKSDEQMRKLFPYALDAVDNSGSIAERCNVEIEFGVTKLPMYDVPEGYEAYEYLEKLCKDGLNKRYGDPGKELIERLEYELKVIKDMGYVDYFLIVWDFINYAKSNNIPVGPGRGSAAGSLVSYTLAITDIDPIKYQLLFERFLNLERISMPDIDIDFCYERRQEIIDYVIRKYGEDRVCQIITFGTLQAKGVIRDVGRALDLSYARCDTIAKLIPAELGMNLDKALVQSSELKNLYETDEEVKYLIDMSKRLEGLPRHSSMHAAGVVITKESTDEYVPLSKASDGSVTTQFTMTGLEELGLLKMDFLGLRTLTVIQNIVVQVRKNYGIEIDLNKLNFEDKDVYAYISTGKTEGIFQIESSGMQSFMKELKPDCLEDIIAGISLYRPGPMDFIPRYIKGKRDKASIVYECPQLKDILSPTYGCIVYQEQVMQIVRELAGYTMGRSDLVRRAMSKKKSSVMEEERQNFVYGNKEQGVLGCVNNKIPENIANKIFDEMIDFAKYAFNKSHAACYAVISYQTAYLKYYYPKEFMAATMSSVIDNSSKVAEYILSCRQMGIKLLPPDINSGESVFSVSGDSIRFGLSAIKSVGHNVAEEIIKNREEQGPYTSMEDFVNRLSSGGVNKRNLENLIKAGALDSLHGNRRQKLSIHEKLLDEKQKDKKTVEGQISLFEFADEEAKESFIISYPSLEEMSREEMLSFEKEILGVYVSGHPLEEFEKELLDISKIKTTDLQKEDEIESTKFRDGMRVIMGGILSGVTKKYTKHNQLMAFLQLEDLVGSIEVIVFPKVYEKYMHSLNEDAKVYIEGKLSVSDEQDTKIICEAVHDFSKVYKQLWLQYDNKESYLKDAGYISTLVNENPGRDELCIYLKQEKNIKKWEHKTDHKKIYEEMLKKLKEENVKLVSKL